jgi:hypothetical protein
MTGALLAGMPTNAERDRPRSSVLDLLYYGLRILK